MARPPVSLLNAIRHLAASCRDDPRSDAQLLDAFVDNKDEGAFLVLVGRHGRLIWRQCAATLGTTDPNAIDDCFQSVLIALAKKAPKLPRENVGGWLFGTARRAALMARRGESRRDGRQREVASRLVGHVRADGNAGFDAEVA